MLSRPGALGLAAVTSAVLLAAPAGGAERRPQAASVEIVLSVNTTELDARFKSPWQAAWIPSGTKIGAIAFTDRGGNQVGLLDPATKRTQNVHLDNITSPGPIVVLDNIRFAVAGTGGVAIFNRAGSGSVTELAMANTRNQALALGPNGNLFVADAQQNDLRIIRPPYSGPADITRFPLPQQCRNPTGVVPEASTIDVLCQQTNNIVRIDYTGNFGSSTALPVANAGAQEARPSPNGLVFSGFNANRFFSFSAGYPNRFKSYALAGPAVPTVGYFQDPGYNKKLERAAAFFRAGKRPERAFFFNSFTPSFRDGNFSFGSFPAATSKAFTRLAGRNLVGSTNGPGGTIWVTDATPGKPALHRISFGDGTKTGRTKTGYRLSERLTQASPDFLARMTMPFFSPVPNEVRLGVTGASASPYNLEQTFSRNFELTLTARGVLNRGGTYPVKVQSADTGAYTRVYRFSRFRPGTKNLTLTFTGGSEIPASFKVDAVAEAPQCECKSLKARIGTLHADGTIFPVPKIEADREGVSMEFFVRGDLRCSGAQGAGTCTGELEVSPTPADRAEGLGIQSAKTTLTCRGLCGEGGVATGRFFVSGGKRFAVDRLGRSVRTISIEIDRICAGKRSSTVVDFAFSPGGKLDLDRSDLDGNGVPDGKEKR